MFSIFYTFSTSPLNTGDYRPIGYGHALSRTEEGTGLGVGVSLYLGSCVCSVAKSCPTLLYPTDCSPPGSSAHGISQARILKWVAISFSKGSSPPKDWTRVSCIGRWILPLSLLESPHVLDTCIPAICFAVLFTQVQVALMKEGLTSTHPGEGKVGPSQTQGGNSQAHRLLTWKQKCFS